MYLLHLWAHLVARLVSLMLYSLSNHLKRLKRMLHVCPNACWFSSKKFALFPLYSLFFSRIQLSIWFAIVLWKFYSILILFCLCCRYKWNIFLSYQWLVGDFILLSMSYINWYHGSILPLDPNLQQVGGVCFGSTIDTHFNSL